ncbi:MAG: 50S ribosomal protein L22 [Anaerolineae bacterium]|nr:50S ribosomal protein L22 [Anaerolineae bacterium]
MTEEIRAHLGHLDISAQKTRLVVNSVRGKDASEAMDILKFTPNQAAKPLSKLIASAMANAEENFGINRSDLYVHTIFADEGPTRRWRRFGARGRFKPWKRRSSNVTVILREKEA